MKIINNILRQFFNRASSKTFVGLFVFLVFIAILSFFFLDSNYWVILLNNFLLLFFVMFQEEFKGLFYKLGLVIELKLRKIANKFEADGVIEDEYLKKKMTQIAKACGMMAKQKIGALITLEIGTSLDEYQKNAVMLESKISTELIYSLFVKESPLHDGAVIIKDFQIKAAGCFFPVSKRTDLKTSYGARHRAAVGISERSDSLTILVSEEKGQIYVVHEGHVSKALDVRELYEALMDRFQ